MEKIRHVRGILCLDGIKKIIAVSSGKGGVGKSTVAVNLALGLRYLGKKVGILDADIYGPSVPKMLGIEGIVPGSSDGIRLNPLVMHGMQIMSIGSLVAEDTSMSWRGPMTTMVLKQLLNETNWSDLEYLVVDMPPGTGDIPITMAKQMPLNGVVLVTTPQDVALIDVLKGMRMYTNLGIPIYGAVENMSIHICKECGREERIFGSGAADRLRDEYGVRTLGSIPLDIAICQETDIGKPPMLGDLNSPNSVAYLKIAMSVIDIAEMGESDEMESKGDEVGGEEASESVADADTGRGM